jgi:hypothetical protein
MDSRPADPRCCGRCAGAEAIARAARRQRFRAAVFARPGGRLSGAEITTGAAGAAGTASGTGTAGAAPGGHPGRAGSGGHPGGGADGAGLFRTVSGTLLDISPHILVVATGEGERRLVLIPGASVWRGGTAQATELRPGEPVLIRLAPGRRDVADKVWASIGRVAGTISASDDGQLTVDEGTTRNRQAVIIAPAAANRIQVRFPQLGPGNLIDVIGLRRGTVLEAVIPATSQPAYLASKVARGSAVVKTAGGTFSGSATWHEPAAPGEEPRGVAYPAIDPAAGCAEATLAAPCPAELPYLAVGSMLSVRNECTGAARVLSVTGCGAAARLFHDRCLTCGTSPRGRVADLTLVSFVELGGDPERACFNATVTVWP